MLECPRDLLSVPVAFSQSRNFRFRAIEPRTDDKHGFFSAFIMGIDRAIAWGRSTHTEFTSAVHLGPHAPFCLRLQFRFVMPVVGTGIATGYGLDDRGVGVPFSTSSRPALGPTQPPIQWVPGAFSGGKAAGA
jgi:hypothetical protein